MNIASFFLFLILSRKMESSQRKPPRKEGDEGYDPYDFEKGGDDKSKTADSEKTTGEFFFFKIFK